MLDTYDMSNMEALTMDRPLWTVLDPM